MVREATDICLRVLKESNKSRFDSFSRYEQCIDHIPYYLSGLSRAHFFRQPFSKQLYTVRTLGLTIISPFGTLSRGLEDNGIWRIVRTPEKILVTPLFMWDATWKHLMVKAKLFCQGACWLIMPACVKNIIDTKQSINRTHGRNSKRKLHS